MHGYVTCVCTYVHTATFFACLCRIHCSVLLQPLEYSTTEANGNCFSCQTQPSHLHVRTCLHRHSKRHLNLCSTKLLNLLAVTIATNQEENAGQEAGPAAGQFNIAIALNGVQRRAVPLMCVHV